MESFKKPDDCFPMLVAWAYHKNHHMYSILLFKAQAKCLLTNGLFSQFRQLRFCSNLNLAKFLMCSISEMKLSLSSRFNLRMDF